MAIQSALNAKGFNAGIVDGILGNRSRQAIRDYQRSWGHKATGKLTTPQRNILLGTASGAEAATAAADTTSASRSVSTPEMNTLIKQLFSNANVITYDRSDFQVLSDGTVTFHYHYTRSGKRTGRYDIIKGNINNLSASVNFVYGTPGGIELDVDGKSWDVAGGPQSHNKTQAQSWARNKNVIISQMAALAGQSYNIEKADRQIKADADSAENGIGQGYQNLGNLIRNINEIAQ